MSTAIESLIVGVGIFLIAFILFIPYMWKNRNIPSKTPKQEPSSKEENKEETQ